MDLLNILSVPQRPDALARTPQKESKDNRGSETSEISFSGILERNQEQPLQVKKGIKNSLGNDREKPIPTEGEKAQGTNRAVTALNAEMATSTAVDGLAAIPRPVAMGQMIKPQGETAVPGQTSLANSHDGYLQKPVPVRGVSTPAEQVLADLRPTGGDDLTTPKMILTGLKKIAAPDATGNTSQATQTALPAKPVPTPTGLEPQPLPAVESGAENQNKDQPLKAAEITTKPAVVGGNPEQNSKQSEVKIPVQSILNNLTGKQTVPPDMTAASEGGAEGEKPLPDFREPAVTVQMSSQEDPVNSVKAPESPMSPEQTLPEAPVDSAPQANVESPESIQASGLDEGSVRVKSILTESHTTTRTASLEQGRQIRQQVIREISSGLGSRVGNEKITLQLNPEGLGQVEIQFSASSKDLNIVMTASSTEAEQALREGIKELAEGITDKSARWQQVDIKVDQRSQDQEKNDPRQENRRDQSRRQDRQNEQQGKQNGQQHGPPDWASLVEEG